MISIPVWLPIKAEVKKENSFTKYELNYRLTEMLKIIFDGLQNALKTTANSLYGQTGAKTSFIYVS